MGKFGSKAFVAVVVVALVALCVWIPLKYSYLSITDEYTVTAVLPAGNPKLVVGTPVYVEGVEKGWITEIRPEDNNAVIEFSLNDDVAPLHDGAFVHVQWKGVIGERLLYVQDGKDSNPTIPDGGRVRGNFPEPMEVSDLLKALDPKTRAKLSSLTKQLEATLAGSETDIQETLRTVGPTLAALGNVLQSIGKDGEAIEQLVGTTNEMVARISSRDQDVAATVQQFSQSAQAMAAQRKNLRAALEKLPATLDRARSVLEDVPSVTEETLPLLQDLQPATAKLASVSKDLAPLLRDLRPMIAQLKPTLQASSVLLESTPALLDSAHATVPGLDSAAEGYMPALEFLRPYTPEFVGFTTNWGSASQNYDDNGRYVRIYVFGSSTLPIGLPGVAEPLLGPSGISQREEPAPGVANDGDPGRGGPAGAAGEGMN